MKIYMIKRMEVLPVTIDEAWEFFSNPHNLPKITLRNSTCGLLPERSGKYIPV